MGPTKATTVLQARHARHTIALRALEHALPRAMVMVPVAECSCSRAREAEIKQGEPVWKAPDCCLFGTKKRRRVGSGVQAGVQSNCPWMCHREIGDARSFFLLNLTFARTPSSWAAAVLCCFYNKRLWHTEGRWNSCRQEGWIRISPSRVTLLL